MKIKTAALEDCQKISTLLRNSFKKINSKDYSPRHINAWVKFDSPKRIAEKINNKGLRNFLAIKNNQTIGFLSLSTEIGSLESLYINPSNIGQGIGSELLEFAEAIVKSHDKKQIKVKASKTAVNFYKKKGYKEIKETDLKIEGVEIPVVEMLKEL